MVTNNEGLVGMSILNRLEQTTSMRLAELQVIWNARGEVDWPEQPETYRQLGERILKVGEPLLAHDVLSKGLDAESGWPQDVRLRQLLGLALARSGATRSGNTLLEQLYNEGHRDSETCGILARTFKDMGIQGSNPVEKKECLLRAHEIYLEGYQLAQFGGDVNGAYYNGINAASTALLTAQEDLAQGLARKVQTLCESILDTEKDYWAFATMGEAALIVKEWQQAEDYYAAAVAIQQDEWAELSSTRRQARFLLDYMGEDKQRLDGCFAIPNVVVFSGHHMDEPGCAEPRFCATMEEEVRHRIRARLAALDTGFGYASAACGSDILFLEEMLERNGEINIVLPFPEEIFIESSVDTIPGSNWKERFYRVCKQATQLHVVGEPGHCGPDIAFKYARLVLEGLARLRTQVLDNTLIPLLVWDRQKGSAANKTGLTAADWQSRGERLEIIDLPKSPQLTPVNIALGDLAREPSAEQPDTEHTFYQRIMAMLFADVVGFSKLTDKQIPYFVQHLIGDIAKLIEQSTYQPAMKNTWGDAFFLVFDNLADAGKLALDICELTNGTAWHERDLPNQLNCRIALHAGPVYSFMDPVMGRRNYMGSHVSRTARIEPITPPGQVYVSEQFAALVKSQGIDDFVCEYAGQNPLPKDYGTLPLYNMRRTDIVG